MSSFLEEFYFGNIDAQAHSVRESERSRKVFEKMTENEEMLIKILPDEYKKTFLEYVNSCGFVNGGATLNSFINGFKLGAKFTYDTFVSDNTPFESLLKGQK